MGLWEDSVEAGISRLGKESGPRGLYRRGGGFFSFLYLKKIKISKIYSGFEKFQNYTPVAPCLGDRPPVALWLGDRT